MKKVMYKLSLKLPPGLVLHILVIIS